MDRYRHCDVARIRRHRHELPIDRDPGDVETACRESVVLAHDAFTLGDPDARALAERVLYALHAYHHFAAPMQATLAVVWSNLSRAKLRPLLVDRVGQPTLTFDELCERMQAAVAEADDRDHGVLDRLDDQGLVLYAKNWWTSTHGFEQELISTLQRSPHTIRQMLFDNLSDELGGDNKPHIELRAATLADFGVDYHPDDAGVLDGGGAFDDPDVFTEAFSVANTRTLYSLLPDPAWSLGSFYTIEAFFPAVCRRILAALRRRGTAEDDLFYWALHGEVDVEHSAEWLEGIERANLGEDTHARIANGAINHLLARSELFGALDQRVPVAVP
jgi:pyrroloquinoline quinone (PQQ) biosynthesis protein C